MFILFKRIFLMMLSVAALFAFSACGSGIKKDISETVVPNEKIKASDYSITCYWAPDADNFTEAEITRMKDAGFDIIPIQRFPWQPQKIRSALALLAAQGLSAAVSDGRISELYTSDEQSQEIIDSTVKEVVGYYSECTNIKEWIICDEPGASKFPVLAKIVDAFRRIDPERKTFINLLPIYAGAEMLGADTYSDYLDLFCKTVNPHYLCYDYYEFLGIGRTTQKRGTYFTNLKAVKDVADKYGLETRIIVLLTEHGVYSNVTRAEIAWQANTSLLYGLKGLSYFTYSHPGDDTSFIWKNSMIDKNGEATQHYYDVQSENKITRVLGNALYHTSSDKVFKLNADGVTDVEEYEKYGRLRSVTGQNALIGFYDNGWFMIMSSCSASEEGSCTVTANKIKGTLLWLNPDSACWEYADTCSYITENSGGGYTISLPAGQALLLCSIT